MGKSLMVIAAIAIATMVYVLLSSALEYLFVGRVRTQQRIDETEHLDKMQNEIYYISISQRKLSLISK